MDCGAAHNSVALRQETMTRPGESEENVGSEPFALDSAAVPVNTVAPTVLFTSETTAPDSPSLKSQKPRVSAARAFTPPLQKLRQLQRSAPTRTLPSSV